MSRVDPLVLADALVADRGLDLREPFDADTLAVCTGPDGGRHALTRLYHHRDVPNPKGLQGTGTHLVTRYAPDGTPLAQAAFGTLPAATALWSGIPQAAMSVLPDGRLLVAGKGYAGHIGELYLLDPALASARLLAPDGIFHARPTPSGRLLCLVEESGVAITRTPMGGDGALPPLDPVTVLPPKLTFPYQRRAAPAFPPGEDGARPTELRALMEAAPGLEGEAYWLEWLWDAVPVDDDLYAVVAVGDKRRCGRRGAFFAFVLVDGEGALRGHLDLDYFRANPGRGHRYDLAVDRRHRRIVHLNTTGMYLFDRDGARLAALPTAEKEYKPLAHFRLHECDASGDLLLVHEKQNLLLTVPLPDDPDDLPVAAADALAAFRRGRTRLKKVHGPENYRWTADVPLTLL
ncbi:hypothetical protein ACIBF1_37600 [Spirillospora sp. NPDC050679]